jgi:hypothetical protein
VIKEKLWYSVMATAGFVFVVGLFSYGATLAHWVKVVTVVSLFTLIVGALVGVLFHIWTEL